MRTRQHDSIGKLDRCAIARCVHSQREAYVLVAVLIVIVVLTLAAYRYSDMMMSEFRASDRILKNVEARTIADSGIQYTMALLADKSALTSTLGDNPYDNEGVFKDHKFSDDTRGRFSIVSIDFSAESSDGNLPYKYGVSDESGRINVNALVRLDPSPGGIAYRTLMKLPNMTDAIAYAIIDWIDADDNLSPSGAEESEYQTRVPAYRCKNAPLDSIEELLLVRGVTPYLLFGDDLNRNGRIDPDEQRSGDEPNYGWAPYLTVYSRELNVDNAGNPRINLNGRDVKKLYSDLKAAVGDQLAAYLVAYRIYDQPGSSTKTDQNTTSVTRLASIGDLVKKVEQDMNGNQAPRAKRTVSSILVLIGSRVVVNTQEQVDQNGKQQTIQVSTQYTFPVTDAASAKELLPIVLDKTTTTADAELPGRINVNTAPKKVLMTLPGLEQEDIENIMNKQPGTDPDRAADPIYQTPAWLYTECNVAPTKLQALERYITARTQVYRIQSIGYFEQSGPVVRVEAVIDVNQGKPRIIYYRDLSELGRAIDPRKN
jgi:type II secretory pathway component PulK